MKSKKRIRKRIRFSRKIKYLIFILLTLTFPLNYAGVALKPQNRANSTMDLTAKLPPLDDLNQYGSNKSLGLTFVIASALTSLVATVLITLIWKYLHDLPIVKKSVLVHLYKDISVISVIAEWTWFITVIASFLNANGTTVEESLAKVISFSFAIIELEMLLIFNIIGVLRLAMIKQRVLDPELPWGENHGQVMKRIRCVSIMFVAIFASAMYLCGGYPHVFYYLIGDKRSLLELPKATLAFTVTLMSLSALNMITALIIRIYGHNEETSPMDKLRGFAFYNILVITTTIAVALVYGVARNQLDTGRYLIVGQFLIF